jgi:transcriptional regulator GlxA family with amidase domain
MPCVAEVRAEPPLGLRERKKQRTHATLIDAAVELCERQGFERTTVDQIAAIADVSPRTFSRYFATPSTWPPSNWRASQAISTISKRFVAPTS